MLSFFGDDLTASQQRVVDAFSILGMISVGWISLKFLYNSWILFYRFDVSRMFSVNLKRKYGGWAVITGSTDGIGKAYAHEFASKGFNLILISRTKEKLQKVKWEIETKHQVDVDIIQADFSEGRPIYGNIAKKLSERDVGILINNVGTLATPRRFDKLTEDDYWNMVTVNAASLPAMCSIVIPRMLERKRGLIVNIASSGGYKPIPYFNVYAATKAFARSFTNALEYEFRGTGVDFQSICPGAVSTKMIEFNKDLHAESLTTPSTTKYVKFATATIGYAKETTGYFWHEVQVMILMSMMPDCVLNWFMKFTLKQ